MHRSFVWAAGLAIAGLGATTASAAVLVDYDDGLANGVHDAEVRNGGFQAVAVSSNEDSFAETPNWFNIGSTGVQTTQAVRDNIGIFPGQVGVSIDNGSRVFALDTEHTLSDGEIINFRYDWVDGFNWVDSSDQMQFSIYTTVDDTIGGAVDQVLSDLSGLSTTNTTVQEHAGSLAASAAMDGKNLFISIRGVSGSGNNDGFAPFDNVFVEVIPEPGSMALLSLASLLIFRRRRA